MTQPPEHQEPGTPGQPPAGGAWAPSGEPGQPSGSAPGQPGSTPQPPGQGYGPPGQGYGPPYGGYQPYPGTTAYQPPAGDPTLAEWWERLVARLIDGLVVGIPATIAWIVVFTTIMHQAGQLSSPPSFQGNGNVSAAPATVFLLAIAIGAGVVLLYFGYDWLQHALWGQTLGKRAMGTIVVNADTRAPISGGAACGRAAVFTLPGLLSTIGSLFILIEVLWLLWDPRRQCLHDKAASTIVIKRKTLAR